MQTGTHNPTTGQYLPLCLQNQEIEDGTILLSGDELDAMDDREVDDICRALSGLGFGNECDDTGSLVAVKGDEDRNQEEEG